MKTIRAKHKIALVDDDDFERLSDLKWSLSGRPGNIYVITFIDGVRLAMHWMIMGRMPDGESVIDHINGDSLDNQKGEEEAAKAYDSVAAYTFGEFARLNFPTTTPLPMSHFKAGWRQRCRDRIMMRGTGVCPCKSKINPWRAHIVINRKQYHLGVFRTKEEAKSVRSKAEKVVLQGGFSEWFKQQVGHSHTSTTEGYIPSQEEV